jgi:hypothetical protein
LHRSLQDNRPFDSSMAQHSLLRPNRSRRRSWGSDALRSVAPVRGRLMCFHRDGPTCRFAYPASTVFAEESAAQLSHPLSKAADHGGSLRLLGRTREQSVPVDHVNSRQADTAIGFASCRFLETYWPTRFRSAHPPAEQDERDDSRILFCDPTDDRRSRHQPPEAAPGSNPLMGLRRC